MAQRLIWMKRRQRYRLLFNCNNLDIYCNSLKSHRPCSRAACFAVRCSFFLCVIFGEVDMKIWNTKYCLTNGITAHEVKDEYSNMVVIPATDKSYQICLHGEGKEWHKSRSSAVVRAEEVKIKKLISLDKQTKKISAIKFDT